MKNKILLTTFFAALILGIFITIWQVMKQQEIRQRAAADVSVRLNAKQQKISIGQETPIQIYLNQGSNKLSAFDLMIKYDQNYLEFVKLEGTPLFNKIIEEKNSKFGTFRYAGTVLGNNPVPESDIYIGTIVLKAKRATKSTRITFAKGDVAGFGEAKSIASKFIDTSISVDQRRTILTPTTSVKPSSFPTPALPTSRFDLNGDGKINGLDYNFIFGCIKIKNSLCGKADLNGDGKINELDLNILLRSIR